ncbi:MAG: hypothetical protein K2P90_00185 [Holosporales bacterium]|nr:hypothetical protein [Holosporales bacterium]
MVKTFIQTIDWHHALRLLRKSLASLLVFSLLASDIAKAMEDEEQRHIVPLLKAGDEDLDKQPPSFVIDGDLPERPPLGNPHIRRASSLSTLSVVINDQSSHTPDLSPKAYSADSLPLRPFQDQISSPVPTINPVPEHREEISPPPPPLLFSRSSQPNPLSVDLKPKEESLLQTLFTQQSVLVQLSPQHSSPSSLFSTIVPSPLPVNDDPLQRSDNLFSGDTDDEEDVFEVRGKGDSSFLIVFDSSNSDQTSAKKRKERQPVFQQQRGSANERTHLLRSSSPSGSQTFSINDGEELDAMAREFVLLEDFDQAPDVRNPPPPPSVWGKIQEWRRDRTVLPQKPTYTLENTKTPWLQAFRPQDRGNSDEEEIGDPRHLSPPVDPSSDESDDAQREDSDSSGNNSPEKKPPSVLLLLEDPNPNSLLIIDSSEEEGDDGSLGDDGGSPQSTHSSPILRELLQVVPEQPGKKPLFSDEDNQNDNFSSPPPPSSAYSPLDDEDLEAGVPSAWAAVMAKLKDLMERFPNATGQLKRFKQQIIDDKSTWLELIAKFGIGPLIGLMYAYAMGPVMMGDLVTYMMNLEGLF